MPCGPQSTPPPCHAPSARPGMGHLPSTPCSPLPCTLNPARNGPPSLHTLHPPALHPQPGARYGPPSLRTLLPPALHPPCRAALHWGPWSPKPATTFHAPRLGQPNSFLSRPPVYASIISLMEYETALRERLSKDGDLLLHFQGGLYSIPVHSQKLKLASSLFAEVITSVLDDPIAEATGKRRKIYAEGDGVATEQQGMPTLQVGRNQRSKRARYKFPINFGTVYGCARAVQVPCCVKSKTARLSCKHRFLKP